MVARKAKKKKQQLRLIGGNTNIVLFCAGNKTFLTWKITMSFILLTTGLLMFLNNMGCAKGDSAVHEFAVSNVCFSVCFIVVLFFF